MDPVDTKLSQLETKVTELASSLRTLRLLAFFVAIVQALLIFGGAFLLAGSQPDLEQNTLGTSVEPSPVLPAESPETFTLRGGIKLGGDDWLVRPSIEKNCERGFGDDYPDLAVGQPVLVMDASGTVIAKGTVDRAEWLDRRQNAKGEKIAGEVFDLAGCKVYFTVSGIPDSDFYQLQIGRKDRGTMTYSKEELNASEWILSFSI